MFKRRKEKNQTDCVKVFLLGQGKGILIAESLFMQGTNKRVNVFFEQTFYPESADIMVVTGALDPKAQSLILECYSKMPNLDNGRQVVIFGVAALNGGIFNQLCIESDHYEVWSKITPDIFIPGEPPLLKDLVRGLEKLLSLRQPVNLEVRHE